MQLCQQVGVNTVPKRQSKLQDVHNFVIFRGFFPFYFV